MEIERKWDREKKSERGEAEKKNEYELVLLLDQSLIVFYRRLFEQINIHSA